MEELPPTPKSNTSAHIASPQLASSSHSVASNVTYFMGSPAGPKHLWGKRMACRIAAKASLVQRFTQVLLSPSSKENKSSKEEEDLTPASKLTLLRMKLENDVERLHERLQQETDLHSALENAIVHTAGTFSTFPRNLPLDAQELLADVATLEVAVSSLEEQMIGLKLQIHHERNERLRNAACQTASPFVQKGRLLQDWVPCKARDLAESMWLCEGKCKPSMEHVSSHESLKTMVQAAMDSSNFSQQSTFAPGTTSLAEENMESAQSFTTSNESIHVNDSMQETLALSTHKYEDADVESLQHIDRQQDSKIALESRLMNDRQLDGNVLEKELLHSVLKTGKPLHDDDEAQRLNRTTNLDNNVQGISNSIEYKSLWRAPNRLSQEMVSCMIGIYCHLADPSEVASGKHMLSDNAPSPSSPFGHVTSSSFSSLSDLSNLSLARSPPYEVRIREQAVENNVDPYRTQEKLSWGDIGIYSSASEVSWMSVGKEQLEYAADALRIFRCLVEQLSRVDAASLGHQEKLAFWINVYNALMMHAYLAYGVPKNDVKYFALMQKAAYTVGGHFFNAMAIEHVLLRAKAPSYRPQIALLLALHKVKIPEGASRFAISRPEPLVMFALSCGAWSSPAVRIYTPENVHVQLQAALHDYVRACVGVSRHGKVLVPKLLHCYARDVKILKSTGEADEGYAIALWLCTFLPTQQAALVHEVLRQRAGHSSSACVTVQPFDFHLRYLFLTR